MIKSIIITLLIALMTNLAYAESKNTIDSELITLKHVGDTELILVKTKMIAIARESNADFIKLTTGYDIHCPGYVDKYRHAKADTTDLSDSWFNGMSITLSHTTDGPSHARSYAMSNTWKDMANKIDTVRCQLDYRGIAGFSEQKINLGLNVLGFSMTGSYGDHVDHKIETKSANVYMKPIIFTGGGGGGDHNTGDYSCAVQDGNCGDSPLIIDLAQDGIHLGDAGVGVMFDINHVGELTPIQWMKVNGDEAFLVRDLNNNGIIDDGSELFGTGTTMITRSRSKKHGFDSQIPLTPLTQLTERAPNGFVALAQFDLPLLGGNDDGYISHADAIWSELLLWRDIDANAITTADELLTLESVGITHLETIPKLSDRIDAAGNRIPYWSWAINDHRSEHNRYKMVDVFFKRLD